MTDVARDKAARLLKKQGSVSSLASSDIKHGGGHKVGSLSTVSFMDEPSHEEHMRQMVKYENSFQLEPSKKFPYSKVRNIIKEVLEGYLAEEKYEPELCRQMTKTISEVIKARVKELMIPRFKVICLVHIGQLNGQGLRIGSRCLWDDKWDTSSSFEFRNNSLFAVGCVYDFMVLPPVHYINLHFHFGLVFIAQAIILMTIQTSEQSRWQG